MKVGVMARHMRVILYNPTLSLLSAFKRSSTWKLLPCSRVSSTASMAVTARNKPFSSQSKSAANTSVHRRSGNYKPSLWGFDYVQSLNSPYTEARHLRRASELKLKVKRLLMEAPDQLELIDDLQKLGLYPHYEDEIKKILTDVYVQKYGCNVNYEAKDQMRKNLYSTALEFRLLRQHGFRLTEEGFDHFKVNAKGDFDPGLSDDTKGLLQVYEASFLLTEDEKTLETAREFTTTLLKARLEQGISETLSLQVHHALKVLLHWAVDRMNARLFIDAFEKRPDRNPAMLELAKLDFNIVQATQQQELKDFSWWWKGTCFSEKLPFARQRLVEHFLWSIGLLEPRHRVLIAKMFVLITALDDIFDIYGNLQELKLFTEAFQRWNLEAISQLPDYMQICYLAVYNFTNEFAYDVLTEQGFMVIPYLRKGDLLESYLQEAKWYHDGHTPSLDEYLNNGWISSTAPVFLSYLYFSIRKPLHQEAADELYKYYDIVRWPSIIVRLADDIGTAPEELKRGDVQKSIQCYMKETGASEEEAQKEIRELIDKAWKNLNQEPADCPLPRAFIACALCSARLTQFMYQDGDGQVMQDPKIKDRISDLLLRPIEPM